MANKMARQPIIKLTLLPGTLTQAQRKAGMKFWIKLLSEVRHGK